MAKCKDQRLIIGNTIDMLLIDEEEQRVDGQRDDNGRNSLRVSISSGNGTGNKIYHFNVIM